MSAFTTDVNSCKYLYLSKIVEPSDNVLRIILDEAISGHTLSENQLADHDPEIRKLLASQGTTSIEHSPGCRVFELIWPSYIGYSIRNESFALPETHEGKGKLFVEYADSWYLDFIKSSTWATLDFPGPFKHWAIYCLNHAIDIVSVEEPTVEVR
jgi:hypothetical protein